MLKKFSTFFLILTFTFSIFALTNQTVPENYVSLVESAEKINAKLYFDPLSYSCMLQKNGNVYSFRIDDEIAVLNFRQFKAIDRPIKVNNEIKPLYETVRKCIKHLKTGGRLCIITFHSLEDRAVKNAYVDAQGKCICPKDLPYCVCGAKSEGKIINKKPIIATEEEQKENSRSKSAKLRIFEKE